MLGIGCWPCHACSPKTLLRTATDTCCRPQTLLTLTQRAAQLEAENAALEARLVALEQRGAAAAAAEAAVERVRAQLLSQFAGCLARHATPYSVCWLVPSRLPQPLLLLFYPKTQEANDAVFALTEQLAQREAEADAAAQQLAALQGQLAGAEELRAQQQARIAELQVGGWGGVSERGVVAASSGVEFSRRRQPGLMAALR